MNIDCKNIEQRWSLLTWWLWWSITSSPPSLIIVTNTVVQQWTVNNHDHNRHHHLEHGWVQRMVNGEHWFAEKAAERSMMSCDWVVQLLPHQVIIIIIIIVHSIIRILKLNNNQTNKTTSQKWEKSKMLKKQLIERPFQMISLIIPFICLSFPAATFHLPTGDQTFLSFHLRLTELTPFDLQLHRLFQAGPCLPIKSRIIITSLITKLINNPSSHFRRQVWWLHGGNRFGIRQTIHSAGCRNPQIWAPNPPLLQAPVSFVLHFFYLSFLSDPGIPGVRSMGPSLSNWLSDV